MRRSISQGQPIQQDGDLTRPDDKSRRGTTGCDPSHAPHTKITIAVVTVHPPAIHQFLGEG